jgi:DNA-3-methyladenine glycosylase II
VPRPSSAAIAAEVAARDPAFADVVRGSPPFALRRGTGPGTDAFNVLAASIVYQQLAGRAAAAIHGRFLALFDGHATPEAVLATPVETLRSVGLSGNKAASIQDLAAKVADGTVPVDRLSRLKDDDIVARLVQVPGIGRWTAEMFLIFNLRRLDVWPVDDYGVRKGWALLHGMAELPKPKALDAEGEVFRPYRTAAAWYCWRAVETTLPDSR